MPPLCSTTHSSQRSHARSLTHSLTRLLARSQLVDVLALGAHGGVNGGANFHPRLFVDLYEAVTRGDTKKVDELQLSVLVIRENVYVR